MLLRPMMFPSVVLTLAFSPIPLAGFYILIFQDPTWVPGYVITLGILLYLGSMVGESVRFSGSAITIRKFGFAIVTAKKGEVTCKVESLKGSWFGTGLVFYRKGSRKFLGQIPFKIYGRDNVMKLKSAFEADEARCLAPDKIRGD